MHQMVYDRMSNNDDKLAGAGEEVIVRKNLAPREQAWLNIIHGLCGFSGARASLKSQLYEASLSSTAAKELQGSNHPKRTGSFQSDCSTAARLLTSFEQIIDLTKQSTTEFDFVPIVSKKELEDHRKHLARTIFDLDLPSERILDLADAQNQGPVQAGQPAKPKNFVSTLIEFARVTMADRGTATTPSLHPSAVLPAPVLTSISSQESSTLSRITGLTVSDVLSNSERRQRPFRVLLPTVTLPTYSAPDMKTPLAEMEVMQKMPALIQACTARDVLTGSDLINRVAVMTNEISGAIIGSGNARMQVKEFLSGHITLAPPRWGLTLTTRRILNEFNVSVQECLAGFNLPAEILDQSSNLRSTPNRGSNNRRSKLLRDISVLSVLMPEVSQALEQHGIITLAQLTNTIARTGESSSAASTHLAELFNGEICSNNFVPSTLRSIARRVCAVAEITPDIAFRRMFGKTPEAIVTEANHAMAERQPASLASTIGVPSHDVAGLQPA